MIELWGQALRSVEAKVRPIHGDRWLKPIECIEIGDGRIRLRAPNRYLKEWFEDHFLGSVLESLEAQTSRSYAVDFEVEEAQGGHAAPLHAAGGAPPAAPPVPSTPPPGRPGRPDSGRPDGRTRHTFADFVVGPTNVFAHAAARAVAESPGSRYNPLYIYGGVGVGKTHLLHAVAHEVRKARPDWIVTMTSAERFVIDYIGSMMNQRRQGGVSLMEEFRTRYRTIPDVLLVDDVQFLSHKDSTQEEFFHTFNTLYDAGKQIVFTCDKLPVEMPGVTDRLRSRFASGLTAEIDNPDLETRVAILKHRAQGEQFDLPDNLAIAIATQVKSNVRDLEGAFTHLVARASIERRAVTSEFVEDVIRSLVSSAPSGLTIEAVQREVASYFDVKLHDLKGPRRHRAVAHPRMIAMYLCRRLTSMSYPEIGSRFGGKDHSTVINAFRKIERLVAGDPATRSIVQTLEARVRRT